MLKKAILSIHLCPFLSWFEENAWQFMVDQDNLSRNCYFDQKETIIALESSVRYMTDIGYLISRMMRPVRTSWTNLLCALGPALER